MVDIEYIRLIPFDFTPEYTDYLLAAKDERVSIEIKFKATWSVEADNSQTLVTFSGNEIRFIDNEGDPLDNMWEPNEFRVGDIIDISGSASNDGSGREILSFSADGSTAIVDGAAFVLEENSSNIIINGITPLVGVSFKYNFIENANPINFNSLIDSNENKYQLDNLTVLDLAYVDMEHVGKFKSNKIGRIQIKSTGIINEFIILQEINVLPFILAGELDDFIANLAPELFADSNSPKYIYEITQHLKLSNPNYVQVTEDESLLGNVAWRDEEFNGGAPNYYIDSIVFKDLADNVILQPDYSLVNKVEITVKSLVPTINDTTTKFTLQHCYIPSDLSEHTNTDTDVETNFMFDQQITTMGAGAVDGRGFGTPKQVLTTINGNWVNSSEFVVTARLDLSPEYKLRMENNERNFYLGVTTQDIAKNTEDSDKVPMVVVSQYTKDLSSPNLSPVSLDFLQHPFLTFDDDDARGDAVNFVEDWQIARSSFFVDSVLAPIINEVRATIIAIHPTWGEFTLQEDTYDVSGFPFVSGIQNIDFEESKGYKMADGNIFNLVSVKRYPPLDGTTERGYQFLYPFKIRWEDFTELANVNPQFFSPVLPHSGFNNDWARFFNTSGWELKFKTSIVIEENNFENTIESDFGIIVAEDYGAATDWSYVGKSYDAATMLEITGNVQADRDTIQTFEFTYVGGGGTPNLSDIIGLMGVAPVDNGGDKIIREISSVHVHEDDSPWVSVLGNQFLKWEQSGAVFTCTAKVDFAQLTALFPEATSFCFTGRIDILPNPNGKGFQDGDGFLFNLVGADQYTFNL